MAKKETKYSAREETQLMATLLSPEIKDNPYNFVMFAFPWGKKNTPLANYSGPRKWQKEELLAIAAHIEKNKRLVSQGKIPEIYYCAVASGRGIGKSAFFAWLSLWMASCVLGSSTVIAANSESQLKSRTFAEVGKWATMMINEHWFEKNLLSVFPAQWFKDILKKDIQLDSQYYYIQGQLWSEETPDAFAGIHNPNGMAVLFDEASGIPANIWDVSVGFFTDISLYRFWFAFSNPRRASGAFYERFNKYRDIWKNRHIDSRTVEGIDKAPLEDIIRIEGEDSDAARIEVKGLFPNTSDNQFISSEVVEAAINREVMFDVNEPLIMAVDPARFGSDKAVIRFRQGRNANLIPPVKFSSISVDNLADKVAELYRKWKPDHIVVDGGGVGGGVVDILKRWKIRCVDEVNFGNSPEDKRRYGNKRTEMWARMRDWLPTGSIDEDKQLIVDLKAPDKDYKGDSDILLLESKDSMLKRGLASPNDGDALSLTFARNFPPRRRREESGERHRVAKDIDFSVFS